jgi:hypothetical protein
MKGSHRYITGRFTDYLVHAVAHFSGSFVAERYGKYFPRSHFFPLNQLGDSMRNDCSFSRTRGSKNKSGAASGIHSSELIFAQGHVSQLT